MSIEPKAGSAKLARPPSGSPRSTGSTRPVPPTCSMQAKVSFNPVSERAVMPRWRPRPPTEGPPPHPRSTLGWLRSSATIPSQFRAICHGPLILPSRGGRQHDTRCPQHIVEPPPTRAIAPNPVVARGRASRRRWGTVPWSRDFCKTSPHAFHCWPKRSTRYEVAPSASSQRASTHPAAVRPPTERNPSTRCSEKA